MPPPLLPKRPKLETEKAQSNKITPREEQQSEKIGKSNHAASSSSSSTQGAVKRRSVFEDVTNASHSQCVQSKEDNIELKSHVSKRTKKGVGEVTQKKIKSSKMGHVTSLSNMEKEFILDIPNKPKTLTTEEPSVFQKTLVLNEEPATKETCLMRKTLKSCAFHQETLLMEKPLTLLVETEDYNEFDTELMTSKKKDKPEDPTIIEEITIQDDSDSLERIEKEGQDPLLNTIYAKDVFNYLKEREEKFLVQKYMDGQMELTSDMRAILVDWLVEIQGSFQMTHETLYLAVKIMGLYLMKAQCKKNHLQLLGSTTYMIAAKFEESYPPSLSEFLFICEDMYEKSDMVSLESSILQTLNFDINIPTAYNFLRRYASCIHASMKTLTLSRFICEMTLQEYEYIEERPSKLAAASFILALYMRNLSNCVPTLEYFTGYKMAELHILVRKLNHLLNFRSHSILKNVFEKYSEETYFEVAKIPPLSKQDLENLLNWALFH
nr:cyclin B3 [Mus musculus]